MKVLKIRDNVDLKELEKFGFKAETKYKKIIGYQSPYLNFYCQDVKDVKAKARVLRLHMGGSINSEQMMVQINDLIHAGLTEVVEKG